MKNKSIVVLLVILLILSFGYIAYDKFVVQKDLDEKILDLKEKVNSLSNFKSNVDNNTENNSDNISSDNSCSKYMDAEFYGELVEDKGEYVYNVKEVLKLNSDGNYENYYENSGYYVKGTYIIENGKINLTVTGGGSMENPVTVGSTKTYEISNDCSTINKDGEVKTLSKR